MSRFGLFSQAHAHIDNSMLTPRASDFLYLFDFTRELLVVDQFDGVLAGPAFVAFVELVRGGTGRGVENAAQADKVENAALGLAEPNLRS